MYQSLVQCGSSTAKDFTGGYLGNVMVEGWGEHCDRCDEKYGGSNAPKTAEVTVY